tara:strand:- start:5231 stop:5416 length:186 start_codon:yes stop_codon:yes gene_type:complete
MNKYIIIMIGVFGAGCVSNNQKPEFKPLPPEKLYDLLHISGNYAYKSITVEDYNLEEECYQ